MMQRTCGAVAWKGWIVAKVTNVAIVAGVAM